jgi:hypothetical protein
MATPSGMLCKAMANVVVQPRRGECMADAATAKPGKKKFSKQTNQK